VDRADPSATAFGALALAGLIIVLFGGFAVINAVFGVRPDIVKTASDKGIVFLGGAAVVAVAFFVIGWFSERAALLDNGRCLNNCPGCCVRDAESLPSFRFCGP